MANAWYIILVFPRQQENVTDGSLRLIHNIQRKIFKNPKAKLNVLRADDFKELIFFFYESVAICR